MKELNTIEGVTKAIAKLKNDLPVCPALGLYTVPQQEANNHFFGQLYPLERRLEILQVLKDLEEDKG